MQDRIYMEEVWYHMNPSLYDLSTQALLPRLCKVHMNPCNPPKIM